LVSFFDIDGNPWSISKKLSAENLFETELIQDNILKILPKSSVLNLNSNLPVLLNQAKFPITLKTKESFDDVYNLVTVIVNSRSPNNSVSKTINYSQSNAIFDNKDFLSFIDGYGDGAKKREVFSIDRNEEIYNIESWEKNGLLIIRMEEGNIISPQPIETKSDQYGNPLFIIDKSFAPDIMVSQFGEVFSIEIK